MKKKLLAVAVAGALAAPGLALAQSSVTISGAVQMSIDNVNYRSTPKTTRSESRLNDESSSIIFTVREDLGSLGTAIVRADFKPNFDSASSALSGESYIGLSTKTAGRFTAGRHNFHFFKTPWDGYGLSSALKTHPTSLIDFAGGGGVPIANATRTPNSLMWSSPNWSGFAMDAGYSFNPQTGTAGPTLGNGTQAPEADLTAGNTLRKGRGWMFNPTFSGPNNTWHVAYSYWSGKTDAATAALAMSDQRSDSLYGYFNWGGFKIGAMWNKSRLDTATTGARVSDRTAWSIPIRYTMGNNNFLAHYTKARDDRATAGVSDGAKMWALTYAYTFSRRTSMSISYAKLDNEVGAAYNFFTNAGGLGSVNAGTVAGEDVRLLSAGMRHNF